MNPKNPGSRYDGNNMKKPAIIAAAIIILVLGLDFFAWRKGGIFVDGRLRDLQTGGKRVKDEIVYRARGVVVEWDKTGVSAFIHHETIEGFMDEMTMLLKTRNTNELSGVKLGDQIDFDLVLSQNKGTHIRNIKPTGRFFPERIRNSSNSLGARLAGSELKPGDPVPDFSLTRINGDPLNPGDLKGKVWALTFMFTRCPVPEYCPLMSQRFSEVASMMQEKADTQWHLVSITMDPDFDTPQKLGEYAGVLNADTRHWDFLSGPVESIREFGKPFGLDFSTEEFPITHNLRTAVINADGEIVKIFSGNQWTAAELVAEMSGKP